MKISASELFGPENEESSSFGIKPVKSLFDFSEFFSFGIKPVKSLPKISEMGRVDPNRP